MEIKKYHTGLVWFFVSYFNKDNKSRREEMIKTIPININAAFAKKIVYKPMIKKKILVIKLEIKRFLLEFWASKAKFNLLKAWTIKINPRI